MDLTGQVVHELNAIRRGARPDDRIFGLATSSVQARIKAVKQAAGLID